MILGRILEFDSFWLPNLITALRETDQTLNVNFEHSYVPWYGSIQFLCCLKYKATSAVDTVPNFPALAPDAHATRYHPP